MASHNYRSNSESIWSQVAEDATFELEILSKPIEASNAADDLRIAQDMPLRTTMGAVLLYHSY